MTGPERQSWAIDEREYARQESRRGRRYAYEALDPARTALVVVDMVPFRNATLRTIYRSFGDVRPTAEVLALLA